MPVENQRDLERALIAEARSGNTDAFAVLMTEYLNQGYRVAYKITDNHEDAQDVLQESLLNAYLHLSTFREESRFATWLVRIVARQAVSKVRRRKSRREVSLNTPVGGDDRLPLFRDVIDDGDDPEKRYLKAELHRILFQTIDYLDPALRVVLVMRELGMLSLEEMAAALEVSIPVAKSRLFRARRKLREAFFLRLDGRRGYKRITAACYPC